MSPTSPRSPGVVTTSFQGVRPPGGRCRVAADPDGGPARGRFRRGDHQPGAVGLASCCGRVGSTFAEHGCWSTAPPTWRRTRRVGWSPRRRTRRPELTTGQLRARLRRLCLTIDPDDAATRTEHAVRERRVVLEAISDGTANLLLLDLPPDLATAARDRIDWLARQLPADDAEHGSTPCRRRPRPAHGPWRCNGARNGRSHRRPAHPARISPTRPGGAGRLRTDGRRHRPRGRRPPDRLPLARHRDRRPRRPAHGSGTAQTESTHRRARSEPGTAPASSPAAGDRPGHPTSTTRPGTPTAGQQSNATWRRSAASHHRAKDQGGWNYRRRTDGDHMWTSPLGHSYVTSGRSP